MSEAARKLTAVELLERFAKDIEAFRRDGPDLRPTHLQLVDELGLPEAAAAKWKEKIEVEWDEAEELKRRPEPDWLKVHRRLWAKPAEVKPANDKGPPKTEVAPSVSEKRDLAKELDGALKADAKPALQEIKAKRSIEEIAALAAQRACEGQIITPNALVAHNHDEWLAAMNERHAVVGNVGGKCKIVEWVPSELDERALIPSFQSKVDFINRYANQQMGWTPRGLPLTLGQWWFENPHRADYRGVIFKPGAPNVIVRPEGGSWLNLWRGWGVMPEQGSWSLLRDHVEQILSNGDVGMADYIIRWTAWGFQNPGDVAEAALVFRGKKGSGKGLWLGTIRKIYGPHGLQITHSTLLTGQFNAHLRTCAYLFADEAFWAGDKQGEAILKGLLTERPGMYTPKGVDTSSGVNCTKVGMSSNSDWVVPATHDERRYAVSDTNNRYAKGVAVDEERERYFGAIVRELQEGGAAAMLYDLLAMNLDGWHPRKVPITTGLMRQKKQSLRGHFQWLEPLLQSGMLPANCGRPNRVSSESLLAYVKTFRGLDYANNESIASFLYDEMGFIPKLSPEGNKFRQGGGGSRGWEFPPLLELRERWETLFGGQWDWHSPEIVEWEKQPRLLDQSVLG